MAAPVRVALVTGGDRGIGLQCAQRLASAGASVVIAGRDPEALRDAAALVDGARAVELDVTDPAAWARLDVEVDILVASAGVTNAGPLERFPVEEFRRILDVNVTGVFLALQAVMPHMRRQGWGRLVAIASSASHVGIRYGAAYAASKHAVVGLMRSAAVELAQTGVTANSVCPGVVDSRMTDGSIARIMRTGRSEEEARAELVKALVPRLGRFVEASEVAACVAYLASEEAAAVNGQSLILDGGGVQQ